MSAPLPWTLCNGHYAADCSGLTFISATPSEDASQLAIQLNAAYIQRLPAIIDALLPEVSSVYGVTDPAALSRALGKPIIDLKRRTLTYAEHTLDDIHIFVLEYAGLFDQLMNPCIDG